MKNPWATWHTHRKDEAVRAALTLTALYGDLHTFEVVPHKYEVLPVVLSPWAWAVYDEAGRRAARFDVDTGEWDERVFTREKVVAVGFGPLL